MVKVNKQHAQFRTAFDQKLIFSALVLGGLGIAFVLYFFSWQVAVGLVGAYVLVTVGFSFRLFLFFPIFIFSITEMFYLNVGPAHLRFYQPVACLGLFVLFLRFVLSTERIIIPLKLPLLLLLVSSFQSIRYSVDQPNGFRLAFLLLLLIVTFVVTFNILYRKARWQKILPFVWFTAFFAAVFAFFEIALVIAGMIPPFRDLALIFTGRPDSIFEEAGWLNAFSMFFQIALIPMIIGYQKKYSRLLLMIVWLALGAINFFCLTRIAWAGFALGFVVIAVLSIRSNFPLFRNIVLISGVVIAVIVILAVPFIYSRHEVLVSIKERVTGSFQYYDPGYRARKADTSEMWHVLKYEALSGYGKGSLATVMEHNIRQRKYPNVASNMFLNVWFEEGLFGLFVLSLFLVALFRRMYKGLKKARDQFTKDLLVGYIAATLALVLTFLASNGFYRGWFWVLLALVLAPVEIVLGESKSQDGTQESDEKQED